MKIIAIIVGTLFSLLTMAQDQTVKALQAESGKTIKKDPVDTSKKKLEKGGYL